MQIQRDGRQRQVALEARDDQARGQEEALRRIAPRNAAVAPNRERRGPNGWSRARSLPFQTLCFCECLANYISVSYKSSSG